MSSKGGPIDSAKTCPTCGAHVAWDRTICPLCHAPLRQVIGQRVTLKATIWGLVAIGGLIVAAAWMYRRHH